MVWTYNSQQNNVRHLKFALPLPILIQCCSCKISPWGPRNKATVWFNIEMWEGSFSHNFCYWLNLQKKINFCIYLCITYVLTYVFTKFFWRTSQIAAEIVRNSTDLLSTHIAIRHLEFRTFVIFHFCAFYMRSKQKKAAKFKF